VADYRLPFDLSPFIKLDEFALLASQDYNFGDHGGWFGCFRGGHYGLHARIYGVHLHYATVHSWLPRSRWSGPETEYHLSSIMFNMDSAVECLAFALNALGNAVAPSDFFDVANARALTQVAPWNIIGSARRGARPGYASYFPTLTSYWQLKQRLLSRIVEQHDVSKHRTTIFVGGQARKDPPDGFYEKLGIPESARADYWPMAEIILEEDPKSPRATRRPSGPRGAGALEELAPEFCDFINTSGQKALEDARKTIHLREQAFRTR
jgi:hypothetical protein